MNSFQKAIYFNQESRPTRSSKLINIYLLNRSTRTDKPWTRGSERCSGSGRSFRHERGGDRHGPGHLLLRGQRPERHKRTRERVAERARTRQRRRLDPGAQAQRRKGLRAHRLHTNRFLLVFFFYNVLSLLFFCNSLPRICKSFFFYIIYFVHEWIKKKKTSITLMYKWTGFLILLFFQIYSLVSFLLYLILHLVFFI